MPLLVYVGCKLAVSALQPVMKEVGSLLKKEIGQVWKVDDKLRELQTAYLTTQTLLHNLESWQIQETTLESWLQDLDRYCYDIEDIVDDLKLSLLIIGEDKKSDQHRMRNHYIKSFRLTIPHQIGELQKKLVHLKSLIEQLLSAGTINSTQSPTAGMPSPPNNLSDKRSLVQKTSRDKDKQIISQLIVQQTESCGVSIIGMDGIGKTSLAQTILNDEKLFPYVLFARVSGRFDIEDIVQKLLEDHTARTKQQNPQPPIESCQNHLTLPDILSSGKYLIILDDLWGVNYKLWIYFKDNCLKSSHGWKILTTTRNPEVAEVTGSTPYYLNRMTDEDCKTVILNRANLSKFERESWSNDIRDIAKKCMGMPIIADELGLTLSRKKMGVERKNSIIQFKTNSLLQLEEFREILPSLNLNEPKWPQDLKRCFAYCSLFSSNHEFHKEDLIQLWEIEGLTQFQQISTECTNPCFKKLLSRSVLQPIKSRDKKQSVYKMHEFNHEFSRILGSNAFCRIGEGTLDLPSSCTNIRHLSLACTNPPESLLKKIERCEGLRTFFLLHHSKPITCSISYNFFHKLHRLRLLDLSHTNISQLQKPIFQSKHLRSLDLSHTKFKTLPESICSLRALEILKLNGCSDLIQLPKDLNQLINLTVLQVEMKDLSNMPSNIGKLTKLEVLDSFFVGKKEGCKVIELKDMEHLRKVKITGLENIKAKREAQETMLSMKQSLRRLVLEWDNKPASQMTNASDVLNGLEPHNHLEDLIVRNYSGLELPPWLTSRSCQLVSINLDNCQNCQMLPSLAQLPFLKNLVFRSIYGVQCLDDHFFGKDERVYPCLELLEFYDMKRLVDWTGLKAGDMPCLLALKLEGCPMLVNMPSIEHLSCLMKLEISDCPILPALPELPSSLNGPFGELVIILSPLVAKGCKYEEGADWPKIKNIPYVEIDATGILTESSCQVQNEKDKVPINEHQTPMLHTGNDVVQNGYQDPARAQTSNERILMVQQTYQDSNYKEHNRKGKLQLDEGSSSNQVLDVASLQQNEILSMDRDGHNSMEQTEGEVQTTGHALHMISNVQAHRRSSKRRPFRGFRRYFGCFSKGHGKAPSSDN